MRSKGARRVDHWMVDFRRWGWGWNGRERDRAHHHPIPQLGLSDARRSWDDVLVSDEKLYDPIELPPIVIAATSFFERMGFGADGGVSSCLPGIGGLSASDIEGLVFPT